MNEPKMTSEQTEAVNAKGRVIVSASAGSGKTFVMIQRLVSLILGGADLGGVLAVTFTNKAAAQMREKLRAELIRKIPESDGATCARLKEQLAALPLADISTIHAFCARLVRTYFYLAEEDPAFRIIDADGAEGKALSSRALDEVFEEAYAQGGEAFQKLLAVYFRGKKDAQLRGVVLSLYGKIRGLADYRERLLKTGDDDFQQIARLLYEEYAERARFCLKNAEEKSGYFLGRNERAYIVCADIQTAAEALLRADGFFAMTETAKTLPKIASMPPTTRAVGEERKNLLFVKELSACVKDLYKELAKYAPYEEERAHYLDAQERARALAWLTLKYDEAYLRWKREAGVLDYNDLEHRALQVLSHKEALDSVREKYRFVFVDEYQDVNPLQERILSLVGGDEVFYVGDAKQSIYGFRGSQSEYFLNKTKEFPHSLLLSENFRSSPAVIEAVNRVFARSMTEESCGIDYLNGGMMRGGARFGEHTGGVRFHTIAEREKKEPPRGVYSVLLEGKEKPDSQAEKVVEIVGEEVGKEWFDADEGMVKQVGYGDIAVLVRKTKTEDAAHIVAALSANNIPVTTTAKVNVCDFWEARLLIDWLSYLDNPEQDIPMAGAMLSRIGGFTDADLAKIRLRFPSPFTFRAACAEYLAKMNDDISKKLTAFGQTIQKYRAYAQVKRAGEMIGLLLSDGLEAEIAAKREGGARLKRVRRLIAEGDCGVNEFLRKIKCADHRIESGESGGENAVKVLTMHAAKGLEYPVVILAGLEAPFHGADKDDVVYTEQLGFAPKSYDLERKITYNTLLRSATAQLQRREELKGELNLLYVAMTRAKYRLHMIFCGEDHALSPLYAKKFSDFFDFSDCGQYFAESLERAENAFERRAFVYQPDAELKARILQEYCRPYAFAESTALPVKGSATGFLREERVQKRRVTEDGAAPATVEEGLAYHAFLQNVRFGVEVEIELDRMKNEGLIAKERLALLNANKLKEIMRLPSLLAVAEKRVFREQNFLVLLPAREIAALNTAAQDDVVVQGAVDLLCEEENGYTILDYKYSSHDDETLKKDYGLQISLYKKAVAKITNTAESSVKAKIINIMRLREIEM